MLVSTDEGDGDLPQIVLVDLDRELTQAGAALPEHTRTFVSPSLPRRRRPLRKGLGGARSAAAHVLEPTAVIATTSAAGLPVGWRPATRISD
jgi:hypothetical protein